MGIPLRPDPLALARREDSQGSQSQCRYRSILGDDWQIAEKDVPDYLLILFGDKGHANKAACSQGIHQAGLVVSTKG